MSETRAEYAPLHQGWVCSVTDQHFKIIGPGLNFACKFPTQLIKAGNPDCRYWHTGGFDLIHDSANGWEIVQSNEKSSLTARIPQGVGAWLAAKIESNLCCSTCGRQLPRENLTQCLDENESPILICSACIQVGIGNQFKSPDQQRPLNSHLQ